MSECRYRAGIWCLDPLLEGKPPRLLRKPARCPFCGSTENIFFKHFTLFVRDIATEQYRCDLWLKCLDCFMAWVHGIHIPKEVYERAKLKYADWKIFGHIKVNEY